VVGPIPRYRSRTHSVFGDTDVFPGNPWLVRANEANLRRGRMVGRLIRQVAEGRGSGVIQQRH
jgi:hypothetical protein